MMPTGSGHPPIVVPRLMTTTMGTSTRKGPAGDRLCHASIPGSSAVVTMYTPRNHSCTPSWPSSGATMSPQMRTVIHAAVAATSR